MKSISTDTVKGFIFGIIFSIIWYLQADPVYANELERGSVEWKPLYVKIVK
tara:strand:- start:445 stop:597 length:153 start_codon:yes stop_codon:yes gene_type:complete